MRQAQSLLSRIESVPRRELYFFALYRVLEAGILAALMFSPLGDVLGQPRHEDLGMLVAIGYLVLALVLTLLVWFLFVELLGVNIGAGLLEGLVLRALGQEVP